MRRASFAILAALGACTTSEDGSGGALSKSQVMALPVTSSMPSGRASYLGQYTAAERSDDPVGDSVIQWRETTTADFAMNANFDTRQVTAGLSNMVVSGRTDQVSATGTTNIDIYYTEFSGQSTGGGVITLSGSAVQFAADLTGTFTALRGGTSANDAAALTGDGVFLLTDPYNLSGTFRGTDAQGVYGAQTLTTPTGSVTTTLWASRP